MSNYVLLPKNIDTFIYITCNEFEKELKKLEKCNGLHIPEKIYKFFW